MQADQKMFRRRAADAEQGPRSLPSPLTVRAAGPAPAGRVSKQAVQLGSRFLTASDHTEETSEGARRRAARGAWPSSRASWVLRRAWLGSYLQLLPRVNLLADSVLLTC